MIYMWVYIHHYIVPSYTIIYRHYIIYSMDIHTLPVYNIMGMSYGGFHLELRIFQG